MAVPAGSNAKGCRGLLQICAAVLGVCAFNAAQAATIDFRPPNGSANGGGYGNSLTYSSDGINVTASAYAETGAQSPANSGWYLLETAQIYKWQTGLGICNRNEGLASSNCNDTEHEVDTVGRDDLLVFVFDQTVNFNSITVDPYNSSGSDPNDRDIVYWVGNLTSGLSDLTTRTFDTLDSTPGLNISAEVWSPYSSGTSAYTHSLTGTGNVLLVSGYYLDRSCKNQDVTSNTECEAYKIQSLSVTPVPVPAAVWLLGSALLCFGAIGQRHQRHTAHL